MVWLREVQEKVTKSEKKSRFTGTHRHHSRDESDGNTKC